MKDLQKPCSDCAFRRCSEPGHLGGSTPEVYIGQTRGPFLIPCHLTYPSLEEGERLHDKMHCMGQCAGSAIFRANCGLNGLLPPEIPQLEPDHEAVFSSPVEFLAHHKGISHFEAMNQLMEQGPLELMQIEMEKAAVVLLDKNRKPKRD